MEIIQCILYKLKSGLHSHLHDISAVLKELLGNLNASPYPHPDSFSMQMQDLTPQSSAVRVRSTRCSQTWLYTQGARERKMTFSSMNYSTGKGVVLRERMHGWISYRSLLNRFDTKLTNWVAWNYLAFMLILIKKLKIKEKSR